MSVRIERIAQSQVDSLLALSIATFTETFAAHNTEEDMKNYIENALTKPKLLAELGNAESEFYFLYEDESPVGFLKVNVGGAQSEKMGDHSLEVERIYLLASTKGRGFGRLLIEKAEAAAREKGKERIWLGVWEHNQPAIRFYEKMGFTVCGEHLFYMGDDAQTDYVMEKRLPTS